jgi:chromosome segregation ATPase
MSKETEISQAERADTIKRLENKRDEYQSRLDEGAVKIEEARRQGKDVSEWESYWLELLKRYGHLSDKIRELQNF